MLTNLDYLSPNYLALQHHGWISATQVRCPANVSPAPCWDVALTPSGVETLQGLIAPGDAEKRSFSIPAVRRELLAITGIAREGSSADVEFTWKWVAINEVGAALGAGDTVHNSAVKFRRYDDGWRVMEIGGRSAAPLDESLRSSQP